MKNQENLINQPGGIFCTVNQIILKRKTMSLRVLIIEEDAGMRCGAIDEGLWLCKSDYRGGAVVIDWEGMLGFYSDYD